MRVKWYCIAVMAFVGACQLPLCSYANPTSAITDNGEDLEIGSSINQIDNNSEQDNSSSGVTSNGSTYAKLLELEEKVRELNGKVQYADYMNKKLIEKINNVSADVNYRLEQIEKNKHPVASTSEQGGSPQAMAPTDAEQQKVMVMQSGEIAQFSEMIKKKNYKEATHGLKKYIKVNADAADLDEAYYLLGKTYFAQNMHEEAGSYFLKYYKYYPTKPRASESLLNLAVSLVKLGRNDKACSILSRIDREYQSRSAGEQKLSGELHKKIKCK